MAPKKKPAPKKGLLQKAEDALASIGGNANPLHGDSRPKPGAFKADFGANTALVPKPAIISDNSGGGNWTKPATISDPAGGGNWSTPAAPSLDPKGIQQMLRDTGFYKGAIDGNIGPMTKAALAKWEAAGKPTAPTGAPTAPAPVARGAAAPTAPSGGGVAAPAPGAGAAPAVAPGDLEKQVSAQYPALAGLFGIPEIANVLRQAVAAGSGPSELAAAVQATNWWRSTPAKARAWIGQQARDPATTQRQVDETATKFKQAAKDYFLNLPDVTVNMWATKVLSGEVNADGFDQYVKQMGKSLNPSLSSAIDRGITPAQYAEPYRQTAARTLQIAPDQIDFSDPKWSKALLQVDPKTGERVSMSLADWQTTLRTDASYGYDHTDEAKQSAAQLAQKLAQTFGKAAS